SPDVMKLPPRKKGESAFSMELILDLIVYGTILGILSLMTFVLVLFVLGDPSHETTDSVTGIVYATYVYRARATAFLTISICMLLHGFNCLHRRQSMFKTPVKTKKFYIVVIAGIISVIPILYIPWI